MHPDDRPTADSRPSAAEYRILARKGPGDTFRVVERRIPARGFKEALADSGKDKTESDYMVQNMVTLETRLYHVRYQTVVREG